MIEAEINYIFTNNEEFFEHLEHSHEKDTEDPIIVKHPIVAILKRRVFAYHKVVVKNLREVIPKNIKRIVLEQGIKNVEFEVFQASHSSPQDIKEWLKPTAGDYQ